MRVGFIGLGLMGASMASNVLARGHELVVNDIRKDAAAPHLAAGARWAASGRQGARTGGVGFTALPGPPLPVSGPAGYLWTAVASHAAIALSLITRLFQFRQPFRAKPWSEVALAGRVFYIPVTVVGMGRRIMARRAR